MAHYPCPDCCGEFTPTCTVFDIEGCFPQAVEDTEITVSIPAHGGASPCDTIEDEYVLTWDGSTWSYIAEDFFATDYDMRISINWLCVDGQCVPSVSIGTVAGTFPGTEGTTWGGVDPFLGTLPFELPATDPSTSFPCDVVTDSAYIIAITGF